MSSPDDDSCPKCGHESGDGLAHFICPEECGDCGHVGYPSKANGCASCWVYYQFVEMTDEEKECMRNLFVKESKENVRKPIF